MRCHDYILPKLKVFTIAVCNPLLAVRSKRSVKKCESRQHKDYKLKVHCDGKESKIREAY